MKLTGTKTVKVLFLLLCYALILCESKRSKKLILGNLLDVGVKDGRGIFLLDTFLVSDETARISVSHTTACAVESAARHHRTRNVYLVYTTPGYITFEETISGRYLKILTQLDNVQLCYANLTELTSNTPAEDLLKSRTIEASKYKIQHYTDILKWTILYKYGGIYLDNDLIVLKSLNDLDPNFVVMNEHYSFVDAAFGFQDSNYKHQLEWLLSEFTDTYDLDRSNGSDILERVVNELCGTGSISQTLNRKCDGLKIYTSELFYPVSTMVWPLIFDESKTQKFNNILKNSYTLHLWSDMTRKMKLRLSKKSPLAAIAKKNCPRISENVRFQS